MIIVEFPGILTEESYVDSGAQVANTGWAHDRSSRWGAGCVCHGRYTSQVNVEIFVQSRKVIEGYHVLDSG